LESVRDETELTKDRPGFEKKDSKDSDPLLSRNNGAPGTEIEQAFKSYQILVEGDLGHRTIDVILNNLADIYQSLLMTGNPAQAALATSQLQTQVAALRTNANRLPQPFSGMLQTAASDVDGDLTNSFHAQLSRALRDNVTGTCQQIVTNRYPFAKSEREVPLVDFGRLFGPQGIIDKFFSSQLAQYVDMSKPNWSWRQDNAIARSLGGGAAALKEFQRAAQIRDTFFATGGLLPSMTLTVTPPPVPVAAQPVSTLPTPAANIGIKFDLNGTPIVSPAGASAPVVAQWPGAGANRSAITVTSDAQGVQPSTIQRTGPWSLFRLIEAGAPIVQNDQITVSYVVGGRELQYKISVGSLQNPFTLPALHEFHCPSDI
jgi:type VI secretion system protein ImpL